DRRTIRTIGGPGIRLREDPVRMLRAVALAARLDFSIDPDTVEAVRFLRGEIVKSSPARILEEFYKILRQGAARRTFEMLHELGLLAYILPAADEAVARGSAELLGSLARLDEALRWLEIHGGEDGSELATHWRSLEPKSPAPAASDESGTAAETAGGAPPAGRRPRRRRRRHRRRPTPTPSTP